MRNSRRGGRLAHWMLQHEEGLKQHPDLQPREPRKGVLGTQEQSRPSRRANTDQPSPQPKVMPLIKVPCFSAANMPSLKFPEFDRQLAEQEKGLNNLTVAEYFEGRSACESKTAARNPAIASNARNIYKLKLQSEITESLLEQGASFSHAKKAADTLAGEKMKSLAALTIQTY